MNIFLQEFICQSRGRSVVSQNWLWPTAEDKKQVKKINGVKKKIKSISSLSESTPQQLQMLSLQGTVKFTQYHRGKQITQRTARHRVYDYFCIVQFFLPVLFSSFFFFAGLHKANLSYKRGQTKCNSEEVYEKAEIKEAWNLTGNRETKASPWRGGSSVSPWWLDLYLCRLGKGIRLCPSRCPVAVLWVLY